jgi:hypothetical protein
MTLQATIAKCHGLLLWKEEIHALRQSKPVALRTPGPLRFGVAKFAFFRVLFGLFVSDGEVRRDSFSSLSGPCHLKATA